MKETLSSKKMIMKEYPYLAFSIKDVREFIKDLKGKKPEKRITKKYIKELYGIKQLCLTRNYEEGFIDALRYYGYLSDKAKERIDKLAGEELANHSPQTDNKQDRKKSGLAEDTRKGLCECGRAKVNHPSESCKKFKKFKPKKKGLKVIDGTPTAISNYLIEREKRGCGKEFICGKCNTKQRMILKKIKKETALYCPNCDDLIEPSICPACSGDKK